MRSDGSPVAVAQGSQKLLALLALRGPTMTRQAVCEALWPDRDTQRSAANLRSALWRLRGPAADLVTATRDVLTLRPVACDVTEVAATAEALREGRATVDTLAIRHFFDDLLPAWYDDWLLLERDRFVQLRVEALVTLCELLAARGRFAEAIEAGLVAVAADPVREDTHRALILAHLAEGNPQDAARHYERYRRVLRRELGTDPSPELQRLVAARAPEVTGR